MHELAITKSIANIVFDVIASNHATGAAAIWIQAGELRNLEEPWVQRYLDSFTRGTCAEGMVAHVQRVPVTFSCNSCGHVFGFDPHARERVLCPGCASDDFTLASGNELSITSIELVGMPQEVPAAGGGQRRG